MLECEVDHRRFHILGILLQPLLRSGCGHLRMQICGIFGVMMVPYFSSIVWAYRCQPFWQVAVPALYYASAMVAALCATFARSRTTRC